MLTILVYLTSVIMLNVDLSLKKLEVGILFFALLYLFSPLISVGKTSFFQGLKAGDLIFVFVLYLLFAWLWRFIRKESLTFELSGMDVLMLTYSLYISILYLFSWRELDQEILLIFPPLHSIWKIRVTNTFLATA